MLSFMEFGAVLPQNELGRSTEDILAFAQAADRLGFDHLLAYDHVLGADRRVHPDLPGPYGLDDTFREPFVLFGYLAGTTSLGFATAILIAPQRPTALIAKQAAEVDLLSGGKLRLGCGIGWNHVEYDALGQDFATRGDRFSEQIPLLRELWTNEQITVEGASESIVAAGLAPLPLQRPIPIWIGAFAPPALRRVGELADGWFPMIFPGDKFDAAWGIITQSARDAGRDPAGISIEGQVPGLSDEPSKIDELVSRWRDVHATHVSINTLNQGMRHLDEHLKALEVSARVLGLTPR